MFPTRENKEEWVCQNNNVVETTFEGGTGAYGNMFTVTSKQKPVRITTLSFHTDYFDGNVTAIVYTRLGDFVGYENQPRAWRKIAESSLRGAGSGFPSTIPKADFEPVDMVANETVAFYITLTTADIRYTRTNITLGKPLASDENIHVNAGVGLADYPFASEFFIYSPRSFNGMVHYISEAECLPSLNVTYAFNVHHSVDITGEELNRLMSSNVEAKARQLLLTQPALMNYTKSSTVSVDSVFVERVEGKSRVQFLH